MSAPITNPPDNRPAFWYEDEDTEPEWRWGAPMPSSVMPCGCFLRRPDYEAVLCEEHLADLNAETS